MMTEQIQAEIGRRARHATNKDELVNAIFTSFEQHQVDPTQVSLEDMKDAVVLAYQSARELGTGAGLFCLA